MPERSSGTVAYLLKAFPRASEPFITSEIHRLEQAGLRLRLCAIKHAEANDTFPRHAVVDRIQVQPEYLPPMTSLTATPFGCWLRQNLPGYLPALRRVARRRPRGTVRAAWEALAQAVRAKPLRRRPFLKGRKPYLKQFLQAVALADRLTQQPDVRHLHAHYAHDATTVAWLAAMMAGLGFSFTAHAKDLYADELNPAGLLGRKLRAARFAVTCTEANRRHLQRQAAGTPVYRIYHGLNDDFSRLRDSNPEWGGVNGTFRLLGVGRLVQKKGFDTFVNACAIVEQAEPALEAVIVGSDGDHGPRVRQEIVAHGLERTVTLLGPLDQPALYDQYGRATAFCLPCRILENGDRDGIPNVLAEAMARGLPVVTTPISGITELVTDGVNGLLVPPDDPDALAAALLRLRRDPALARRLGEAAQATIRERFDADTLARQLAALFREAIA